MNAKKLFNARVNDPIFATDKGKFGHITAVTAHEYKVLLAGDFAASDYMRPMPQNFYTSWLCTYEEGVEIQSRFLPTEKPLVA